MHLDSRLNGQFGVQNARSHNGHSACRTTLAIFDVNARVEPVPFMPGRGLFYGLALRPCGQKPLSGHYRNRRSREGLAPRTATVPDFGGARVAARGSNTQARAAQSAGPNLEYCASFE